MHTCTYTHTWGIQRYIRQPGYIAGVIYGPQGLRYKGFPLYAMLTTTYLTLYQNFKSV